MTPSEEFVYRLAHTTFLPLWTYANPVGEDSGKELCDVLIVCRPDVVIFSVKEIQFAPHAKPNVAVARCWRKAVDASVSQLYGAAKRARAIDAVTTANHQTGVNLGPLHERRIHRVAVSLGAKGSVPLISTDFGKGFVHVYDDSDVELLLREFDTITDFIEYLTARERVFSTTTPPLGTEADLIAEYMKYNRTFSSLALPGGDITGSWATFSQSVSYRSKKIADEKSYAWDRLVTMLHDDYAKGNYEFGGDLSSVDAATRAMAREDRFSRRALGAALTEFLLDSSSRARALIAPKSHVGYVFLKIERSEEREKDVAELVARCWVVRDQLPAYAPVVGIAIETSTAERGFQLDVAVLDVENWTSEMHERAVDARETLGLFKSPRRTAYHEDEYPH